MTDAPIYLADQDIDRSQSEALATAGKLAHAGSVDPDLREVVTDGPTWHAANRSAFFGNLGYCDAALAVLCFEKALTNKVGLNSRHRSGDPAIEGLRRVENGAG